jgi:hypothetical protein
VRWRFGFWFEMVMARVMPPMLAPIMAMDIGRVEEGILI